MLTSEIPPTQHWLHADLVKISWVGPFKADIATLALIPHSTATGAIYQYLYVLDIQQAYQMRLFVVANLQMLVQWHEEVLWGLNQIWDLVGGHEKRWWHLAFDLLNFMFDKLTKKIHNPLISWVWYDLQNPQDDFKNRVNFIFAFQETGMEN